ncbi:GtrA family protein [Patescibacteria group bacterium]|nr:MAG: GtrA family protein [Patescibacteria group bacterium]
MNLKRLIKKHISFIRYVVAGALTVGVDVGLLYILVSFFQVEVYIAATVSFVTSLVVNFTLNKLWSFGARSNTPQQVIVYSLVILLNYLVGLAMIALAKDLHLGYMVGKVSALIITTLWNFFLYKYVVFINKQVRLGGLNDATKVEPLSVKGEI